MKNVAIGISGWVYPDWRGGNFYPKGLKQKDELSYAAERLDAIEINSTFYRLQSAKTFQKWSDQVPEDFKFAIKGSRYITHRLRAKEPEQPMANFFASGMIGLGPKLGPFLWQFPPTLPLKDDRFEKFVKMLPKNFAELSEFAQRHNDFVADKALTESDYSGPVHHAIEVRHASFLKDEKFLELLLEHQVALVLTESETMQEHWDKVTSDIIYMRMHGLAEHQKDGYSSMELDKLAGKIAEWSSQDKKVFTFFDNDEKALAPQNALSLRERVQLQESA